MKVLKKIAATAGILAAAGVGETVYFYNRTMKRGHAKTERTTKMSGTDWEQYFPLMEKRKEFVLDQPHSDVYMTSYDGLKLHAVYFPALRDSGQHASAGKVVICFHGYTGEGLSNYVAMTDYFLKHGYAVLLPDARAHGQSEGEYIGFGVSASSHINNIRFTNTFDLDEYFKCILSDNFAVIDREEIDKDGQEEEYIMLRLRTSAGLDLAEFKELFNTDFTKKYAEQLKKLSDSLTVTEKTVKIKDEYLFVQNSIIVEFFN